MRVAASFKSTGLAMLRPDLALSRMMPRVQKLVEDDSQHVRAALARDHGPRARRRRCAGSTSCCPSSSSCSTTSSPRC